MKGLNSRGDTIVEVMICLAIMGLTVATAYSIANRSQLAIQGAQERTEATKLAETQVERLRHKARNGGVTGAGSFCIDAGGVERTGNSCKDGTDNRYSMGIVGSGNSYTITVSWDRLGGNQVSGQEKVNLYYRVN